MMVYSIGATIGPLLAATLMSIYGPYSFFLFESAVAVAYAVYVLFKAMTGPELPEEGRERYVPLPDISPVAMALDPRTEPHGAAAQVPVPDPPPPDSANR